MRKTLAGANSQVLIPVSFGISAPHCCKSQADCRFANHATTTSKITMRVNSGSLNTYDRILVKLN